jgi:N-acetylmuramoyl-L-alanine amidase
MYWNLKMKVAVDAGHGGENRGAEGTTSHIAKKNIHSFLLKNLEKHC